MTLTQCCGFLKACGSPDAAPGMHYHDIKGNPIVNHDRFPNFKDMTDHAHSLNLTSGWYGNNCDCSDHCRNEEECAMQIEGDVKAMTSFNFDAWKLDGCGGEKDLVLFNKFMQQAGKPIMVENCHWGSVTPFKPDPSKPPAEGCPWNFYRTSGDVRASYASVVHNLATTVPLAAANLSYPGCWAYPDMLQVGCKHGPGGAGDPGLTMAETRSHFGAWVIVSSPLTLSHDVWDKNISDSVWPIISNKEVLEVSAAYVGHSGSPFTQSEKSVYLTDSHIEANEAMTPVKASSYQYLYKPVEADGAKTAVLMMNSETSAQSLTVEFKSIPGVTCSKCHVRNIWEHKDLGVFDDKFTAGVGGHDAAFLIITPAA